MKNQKKGGRVEKDRKQLRALGTLGAVVFAAYFPITALLVATAVVGGVGLTLGAIASTKPNL